jgi:uncharacterized protein (TIGR02996 family)
MSQADAFLEAIRAEPWDETHRLVYADWLEDRGDPRGAFIHAQCRLETLAPDHPDRLALEEQVQDFLLVHGEEWSAPVRGLVDDFRYKGGFIEVVSLVPEALVQNAARLFAAAPVRTVKLALSNRVQASEVARLPELAHVEKLDLSGRFLDDDMLQPLLASPHFTELRALHLSNNRLTGLWLGDAEPYPALAHLEELDLTHNHFVGDRTVQMLAASRTAAWLRSLRLTQTNVTARAVLDLLSSQRLLSLAVLEAPLERISPGQEERILTELAGLPALGRLTHLALRVYAAGATAVWRLLAAPLGRLNELNLANCSLTPECWQAVARSPHLTALQTLDLANNRLTSDALKELAESPVLAHLSTLRLAHNCLQDRAAKALAASPHLPHLTHLDLNHNEIGGPGIVALAGSPNLARLAHLDLSKNFVGVKGVQALATSPHLTRLTYLALNDNRLEPESAEALAGSPNLEHLTSLHLQANRLGEPGVQALARSPHLTRLTTLTLNDNHIGRDGVEALLASTTLRRLQVLELRNNDVSSEDAERLRQRFGSGVQV